MALDVDGRRGRGCPAAELLDGHEALEFVELTTVPTRASSSTLNSSVYCRFGTDSFMPISSSVHQKLSAI